MNIRTTLVDRRLVAAVLEGIPELPESVVKYHLAHLDDLHRAIAEMLLVPMSSCAFKPGVLEAVRLLGGQYAEARLTQVPGNETLESQRRTQVIKFWTDWHFKSMKEGEELQISPSLGTEVVYLHNLVEGSLRCTFDRVEGKKCVEDILTQLPVVEGLRWVVGNSSTITRVLANHLRDTGQYLLPTWTWTWTTDTYKLSEPGGLHRLLVGDFGSFGVHVSNYPPGYWDDSFGLFVLGVPA